KFRARRGWWRKRVDRQTARSGGEAAGEPSPAACHAGVREALIRIWWAIAGPLVVVAAALPLSWACAADDVLDALGPELLGSPVGRVLEESKFSCTQDRTEPDMQRCTSRSSALTMSGGVSASAMEALIKDRRLLQVAVYFPEAQFTRVLAVLSTRF